MSRTSIALVVFLALLAIVAGLYATGPKYVVTPHHKTRWQVLVACDNLPTRAEVINYCGDTYLDETPTVDWKVDATWDTRPEAYTYTAKFRHPGGSKMLKAVVWDIEPKTTRWTTIRRASAWERVWYALVGSKNTRG
jgi:hypothetical protein